VVLEHMVAGGGGLEDLWRALLAWSSARTGREARARELLDRERVLGFSVAFAAQGGAEPACAWAEAAVLVEDTASATALRAVLEPLAGRFLYVGAPVWDTIDRHRALLRLATGDAAEAAEIAAAAVAESRRRRTPIFLARELIVLACAQQRLGVDETDDLLEEAFAIARRTRARLIEQDARLFLAAPAGALTPPDHFGLTRREREVVDLVASGATNAQVAATLGIAPATVRKHLEHAYEKLDVSTRTAAVARAAGSRRAEGLGGVESGGPDRG
jgi:DNA-binding CsgD family transcriptional regulator